MSSLDSAALALFFTRRVGLTHWDEVGNLDREVEIYRRLAARMASVTFITYGGRRDRELVNRIDPVLLCRAPRRAPGRPGP